MEMEGTCKLCLEKKNLIKRSHLFPNFMYKGISDEKNRMNVIDSSNPFQKKTVQTGAYEEYILCKDCDNNLLSKLERYANNHFYSQPYRTQNEDFDQIDNGNGIKAIHCKSIDYKQFKLFLQSLIWRASVSTHGLFKNFKLSAEQEEQLRNSLLNSLPLDEFDFGCVILTHDDINNPETDLVFVNSTQPRRVSFIINQFIYLFYFNEADIRNKELVLNKKNEMGIIKLADADWQNIRASIYNGVSDAAKRNHGNEEL